MIWDAVKAATIMWSCRHRTSNPRVLGGLDVNGPGRAGSGINFQAMLTVAWRGMANDCEHPFGGRRDARTDSLPGCAGADPSDPA
jgi:hypothetical protein